MFLLWSYKRSRWYKSWLVHFLNWIATTWLLNNSCCKRSNINYSLICWWWYGDLSCFEWVLQYFDLNWWLHFDMHLRRHLWVSHFERCDDCFFASSFYNSNYFDVGLGIWNCTSVWLNIGFEQRRRRIRTIFNLFVVLGKQRWSCIAVWKGVASWANLTWLRSVASRQPLKAVRNHTSVSLSWADIVFGLSWHFYNESCFGLQRSWLQLWRHVRRHNNNQWAERRSNSNNCTFWFELWTKHTKWIRSSQHLSAVHGHKWRSWHFYVSNWIIPTWLWFIIIASRSFSYD